MKSVYVFHRRWDINNILQKFIVLHTCHFLKIKSMVLIILSMFINYAINLQYISCIYIVHGMDYSIQIKICNISRYPVIFNISIYYYHCFYTGINVAWIFLIGGLTIIKLLRDYQIKDEIPIKTFFELRIFVSQKVHLVFKD